MGRVHSGDTMKKLGLICLIGCTASPPPTDTSDAPGPAARPVYLTVAGHLEDDLDYTDCAYYLPKRDALLDFGALLHEAGVPFRIQASYEWFSGARACEDEGLKAETGGVSSIEYMASTYDFAIDPHQEGASITGASSGNNFADIHWAAQQVCSQVSEVTGFQWDNPTQYASFQAGERGLLHPEHVWSPRILSGGVSQDHTGGDFSGDMSAMGIWIPSDFGDPAFYAHDEGPDARMVYVGSGPNQWIADWAPSNRCHYEYTADFIEALVTQIERGDLDDQGWHTFTFFIPQRVMLNEQEWPKVTENLSRLEPLIASGKVVMAQYEDIIASWRDAGAQPYVLRYDDLDDSLRTCAPPP